jgi:hypothetical protein
MSEGPNPMNNRKTFACIVAMGMWISPGVNVANIADDDNARALLELLKAKDKAFDNAILRYTRSGEEVIDFPWWKYPPRTPEEKAEMEKGPQHIKFRFREQMVVRGRDTTFTREADPDMKNASGDWSMAPYQKWSEIAGVVSEMTEMPGSGPRDRTFEIRKNDHTAGIVGGQRMEIEFAHGFGFGERIKTIDSLVRAGKIRILQGAIQLWSEDVSTYRIELGDDLLVKKGTINVDAAGNLTRYGITTEGATDRHGFLFAATGHFQRIALGLKKTKDFKPRVTDEFFTKFNDARFHLRDEEYKRRIMIEITPGTQVNDFILNKVYRVERDNSITNLGPAVPKKP